MRQSEFKLTAPVLDSLGQVRQLWLGNTGQIGDGQGNFEDTMVGTSGKPETCDGGIEQIRRGLIKTAELFHLPGIHLRVAVEPGGGGKAFALSSPCLVDSAANGCRRLARGLAEQLLDRNRRDLEMDVDAIKQGAG